MSNSGLYGSTGNVTVSANNLTTLYNSVPGATVTTQNVADRNFTTLYASRQADVNPTKAYGNANVEAFLNIGEDQGGNVVQNINMSGSLTVGKQSNLGPVGNVHITGGTLNYVLATDGSGGLSWVEPSPGAGEPIPYIHFDVVTTANNQQFSNVELSNYLDANTFNLFKNGVNIEPFYYEKIDANTVQVNIPLASGDTIDILATGGSGGLPGGNITEIQYNGGSNTFSGNSSFTFDQANSLMTIGNISIVTNLDVGANINVASDANIVGNLIVGVDANITGNLTVTDISSANITFDTINGNVANVVDLNVSGASNLGDVANIIITGGTANYVLQTDGAGNLSWAAQTGGNGGANATSLYANIANVHIYDGSSGQVLSTDGTGNLSWISAGGGSSLTGLTDANVVALGNNYANTQSGGTVLIGDDANASGSSSVAVGKNANGGPSGVAVGLNSQGSGGGTVALGPYSDAGSGAYGIAIGIGSKLGSGAFNIALGVDVGNTTSVNGNNNVLVGRGALPSSSSVDGEITLGGSVITNTRIPYGNLNVTNTVIAGDASLSALTVTGTTTIQQAKEKVTANGTGATGTINYDVLTQAIVLQTANATANFTLNIRGDSGTSLNTVMSTNESLTLTYINKNGSTGYYANLIQIDNANVTPVWPGGSAPISGTPSGYDMYNFNILKTAANTYVVFGTVGSYE